MWIVPGKTQGLLWMLLEDRSSDLAYSKSNRRRNDRDQQEMSFALASGNSKFPLKITQCQLLQGTCAATYTQTPVVFPGACKYRTIQQLQ